MREGRSHETNPEHSIVAEEPKISREGKSALFKRLRGKARFAVFALSGLAGVGASAVELRRGGQDYGEAEQEAQGTEKVPEFPSSAALFRKLLGFEKSELQVGSAGEVSAKDADFEATRKQLDKLVAEAIKDQAGAVIAQSCQSAQQCYLFYDGQLNFTPEARAALAEGVGMTEEELDFCRDIMQKGYLIAPGLRFPGTVTERDEVGYGNFPSIMSEAQKKRFYDEVLYPRHVAMIKEHLRNFGVLDLPDKDQREIKELLADLVKAVTESEVAALHLDVVYANFRNYRLTRRHEEARFKEREDFLRKAERLIDRLFETYAACGARTYGAGFDFGSLKIGMKQAVRRREHTHRLVLYQNLLEQLRKDWTTRAEAPEFEERIDGELAAIRDIDAELAKISGGKIILAKK